MTDRPTNRPINKRTRGFIGKLRVQSLCARLKSIRVTNPSLLPSCADKTLEIREEVVDEEEERVVEEDEEVVEE